MNAVVGSLRQRDASGLLPFGLDEWQILFGRKFLEDLGEGRHDRIMLLRIGESGPGASKVFVLNGAEKYEADIAARTGLGDELHQLQ